MEFSSEWVAAVKRDPIDIEVDGQTFRLTRSTASVRLVAAELQVERDGEVLGYITGYSEREYGAVPAQLFGQVLPRVFTNVHDAVREAVGR